MLTENFIGKWHSSAMVLRCNNEPENIVWIAEFYPGYLQKVKQGK